MDKNTEQKTGDESELISNALLVNYNEAWTSEDICEWWYKHATEASEGYVKYIGIIRGDRLEALSRKSQASWMRYYRICTELGVPFQD